MGRADGHSPKENRHNEIVMYNLPCKLWFNVNG